MICLIQVLNQRHVASRETIGAFNCINVCIRTFELRHVYSTYTEIYILFHVLFEYLTQQRFVLYPLGNAPFYPGYIALTVVR